MIEAKDLRIGDIVRMTDDNGNMVPCKVVGVDMEICHNSKTRGFLQGAAHLRPFDLPDDEPSDSRWCEDIEPIPLTLEILEKNGWENCAKIGYGEYRYTKNDIYLEYFQEEKRFVYQDMWESTSYFCINYIHQLQHLLWTLGENAEMEV